MLLPSELENVNVMFSKSALKSVDLALFVPVFPPNQHLPKVHCRLDSRHLRFKLASTTEIVQYNDISQVRQTFEIKRVTSWYRRELRKDRREDAEVPRRADVWDDEEVLDLCERERIHDFGSAIRRV